MIKKGNLPRANGDITATSVRVVDEKGGMLGVMSISEALEGAKAKSLDLIEISPNAEPPVCKFLDFGKYKYEAQKKAHDARKKQKVIEVKEIKIRPNISEHDLEIKVNRARKFLEVGNKVKVSMRFRGREISKQDLASDLIHKVIDKTSDLAKTDLAPRMEGRQMLMILAPIK